MSDHDDYAEHSVEFGILHEIETSEDFHSFLAAL